MIGDLLFALLDLLTDIFIVNKESEDSNPICHGVRWISLTFSALLFIALLLALLFGIDR